MNIQKSTYSSRISRIKNFQFFFLNTRVTDLQAQFNERLKQAIEKQGLSIPQCFKAYVKNKISLNTLRDWINGHSIPQHKNYFIINEIEAILNLPPETLTSVLPKFPFKVEYPTVDNGAFNKILKNNRNEKYAVWTEETETELQDLAEYKSCTILPENLKRSKSGIWTFNEKGEVPTAQIAKKILQRFFGFCHLPKNNDDLNLRGMGINKAELTIALLTDKHIAERYITVFSKARSNSRFNGGHINCINAITCLLRNDTGYLYQKPELAKSLGLNLSVKEWQNRCMDTRNRLLEIRQAIEQAKKSGNGDYGWGRDPTEPIKEMLELQNPASVTMQMTMDIAAEIEKLYTKPIIQAVLYRNMLITALLQANPLRARMVTIMEIKTVVRLALVLVERVAGEDFDFFIVVRIVVLSGGKRRARAEHCQKEDDFFHYYIWNFL